MKTRLLKTILKRIFISLFTILWVVAPLWLVVVNSFKDRREASLVGFNLPTNWNIVENYTTVISESNFLQSFLNSAIIVITVVPTLLIIAGMAGWIFARVKAKVAQVVYYILMLGIIVPPSIVSSIKVMDILNIHGTRAGLYLFYVGIIMSFTTFFTTGFIKSIPVELEEAARIDGCNNFQIFFRIIFPLLRPVFATVSVFIGIRVWNDFMWPFYMLKSSTQHTLVLGLFKFIGGYDNVPNVQLIFTDVILVSLPLITFYIIAQKFIVSGIMGGAVKQ